MIAGRYSEVSVEAGAAAGKRAMLAAFTRVLLRAVGFSAALWLRLHWFTTMHTDFAQNAWLPARLLVQAETQRAQGYTEPLMVSSVPH